MWQIANAQGVALDTLVAANPQVQDPSVIEVGQVLNLPPASGAHDAARQSAPVPPPPAAVHPYPMPVAPSNEPRTIEYTTPPPPPSGAPTFKTVAYFTNWVGQSCNQMRLSPRGRQTEYCANRVYMAEITNHKTSPQTTSRISSVRNEQEPLEVVAQFSNLHRLQIHLPTSNPTEKCTNPSCLSVYRDSD